jgi:hypothetical protein
MRTDHPTTQSPRRGETGPAAAFAWEFQRQHQIGLAALTAYLIAFVVIKILVLAPEYVLRVDPPNGLAAFIIVPVTSMMFYLVGVFTFGLTGDLAGRPSIYPAHKLTLPITSRALAGWPMLYGTVTMFVLYLVTALLLRWVNTRAFVVPLVWPGLLAATYLAWTQAFMWMPYGLRGVRVIIAVVFLTAVDAIVFIAIDQEARELTMIALLAPQLPLAYLLAWSAVARARRGDVPDWSIRRPRATHSVAAAPPDAFFATPARAQLWFEWRQHGWTLPAMVGMVVPAMLLLLFIPVSGTARTVFVTLFAVIVMPPFLAAFAAGKLATSVPFTAVRPLTTASLVAAKLTMSILSTLVAWIVVAVAVVVALEASGTSATVIERARAIIEVTGPLRFFVVTGLILGAAVASTWKHLVQSLCIGLSGRPWLIKSSVLLALTALMATGPFLDWLWDRADVQSAIWHGLPWIFAALVLAKAMAASAVAMRLHQRALLSDRAMIGAAVCWLAVVAALYGVQVWLAESPLVPRYYMGALAILPVPLTRVAAAPLALAWSRHQ